MFFISTRYIFSGGRTRDWNSFVFTMSFLPSSPKKIILVNHKFITQQSTIVKPQKGTVGLSRSDNEVQYVQNSWIFARIH